MADREDREEWRREHSLLALGRAIRGDEPSPPPVPPPSVAGGAKPSWQRDAIEHYGLARPRPETAPGDMPSVPVGEKMDAAASISGGVARPDAQGRDENPSWFARLLPRWARLWRSSSTSDGQAKPSESDRSLPPATASLAAPAAERADSAASWQGRSVIHARPMPAGAEAPTFPGETHQEMPASGHQPSIEEIRASLREFREAVRELTERRSRRYF